MKGVPSIDVETLNISNRILGDISFLAKYTKLRYLTLFNTNIEDISPLSHLTNLRALDLGITRVQDISCLSRLTKLTILNLTRTRITSIQALSSLSRLEYLNIVVRPYSISKSDILHFVQSMQDNNVYLTRVYSSTIHDDEFRKLTTRNMRLRDTTKICVRHLVYHFIHIAKTIGFHKDLILIIARKFWKTRREIHKWK